MRLIFPLISSNISNENQFNLLRLRHSNQCKIVCSHQNQCFLLQKCNCNQHNYELKNLDDKRNISLPWIVQRIELMVTAS